MTITKREKIANEEGFGSRMYKCPADKWTIGNGFNLEAIEMPKVVADLWLGILIDELEEQLYIHDWYANLNHARQVVIIDMSYQMGISGMLSFRNMVNAIICGDYDEAADHMLDSKYAHQTPERASRNYRIMKEGEL